MGHYQPNPVDLEFTLFEVLGCAETYGRGAFAGTDVSTARTVLAEVARLATGELADAFTDADRNPPVYDPVAKALPLPASLKRAYRAWMDGGWHLLDLSPSLGGAAVPPSLRWAVAELALGANPAVYLYQGLAGFAQIIDHVWSPTHLELVAVVGWRGRR